MAVRIEIVDWRPVMSEGNGNLQPFNNQNQRRSAAYWKVNLLVIAILLAIWATVSFGCGIILADWLNQFKIGKLPAGFWFAQQGSIYIFVVLIFVYAWLMDRLDKSFGVNE